MMKKGLELFNWLLLLDTFKIWGVPTTLAADIFNKYNIPDLRLGFFRTKVWYNIAVVGQGTN